MPRADQAAVGGVPNERPLGLTNEARISALKRYWDIIAAVGERVDISCLCREPTYLAMAKQCRRIDRLTRTAISIHNNQYRTQRITDRLIISLIGFRKDMRIILERYGVEYLHSRDYGAPQGMRTWPNIEQLLAYYEPRVLEKPVERPLLEAEFDELREGILKSARIGREGFETQLAVVVALLDKIDEFDHGYEIFLLNSRCSRG